MQPGRIPFQKVAKVSNFLNKGIYDQCLEYLSFVSRFEIREWIKALISFLFLVPSCQLQNPKLLNVQGDSFHWASPKKLKYRKSILT